MKGKLFLKKYVPFLLIIFLIQSCIVLPKTVPEEEDQDCLLATKSMTIDFKTSPEMIDEAVDEMIQALASDCHEPECLLVLAPIVAICVGSMVVSGSIVVAGNTIHWMEKQGRCDDSVTRQSLKGLNKSAVALGGTVINTSMELIEWFQGQESHSEPTEDVQEIEE
jgi:hypothetical protein